MVILRRIVEIHTKVRYIKAVAHLGFIFGGDYDLQGSPQGMGGSCWGRSRYCAITGKYVKFDSRFEGLTTPCKPSTSELTTEVKLHLGLNTYL